MTKCYDEFKSLIDFSARCGHGVFSLTMLESIKSWNYAKVFVHRKPSLFWSIRGTHGDIRIFKLTKEGCRFFNLEKSTITSSESPEALTDILLINSFLVEKGIEIKYKNTPYISLSTTFGKVGVLSRRWGVPREVENLDILLSTPQMKKDVLKSLEVYIPVITKSQVKSQVIKTIENAYTPIPLKNLRPIY